MSRMTEYIRRKLEAAKPYWAREYVPPSHKPKSPDYNFKSQNPYNSIWEREFYERWEADAEAEREREAHAEASREMERYRRMYGD